LERSVKTPAEREAQPIPAEHDLTLQPLQGPEYEHDSSLPEPVDLVLVVDTYHHIPNRVAYFTALRAHLKSGARLAIVDFRKDSPSGPPVEFRFTPDQISAELASAGFSLLTSHDFLLRQIFLIYGVK
jgi:hypothetical protein